MALAPDDPGRQRAPTGRTRVCSTPTATVHDCNVSDALVVDIDTGEVVNDEVVTRSATGTLRRIDGVWKVATTRVEQAWEGGRGVRRRRLIVAALAVAAGVLLPAVAQADDGVSGGRWVGNPGTR
jgi:hypothetical protein